MLLKLNYGVSNFQYFNPNALPRIYRNGLTVTGLGLFSFTARNTIDAKKYEDLLVKHISERSQIINPPPFIVDLTSFGIPTIKWQPETINLRGIGQETINYPDLFHSDSSETLNYTAVSKNPSIASVRIVTSSTSLVISGVSPGNTTVDITASNGYGSITLTLTIAIN